MFKFEKITFKSGGLNCSALFYVPMESLKASLFPAIVMAHGIGSTKEMSLPRFAEIFAAAGFAVLLFDYRYLGQIAGSPRGQVFPEEQQEDYRNAITRMQLQPQVDPEKIGVWGTSYSGGHVLHISTYDRSMKCVVAQVPVVSGLRTVQRLSSPTEMSNTRALLSNDRVHRYSSGEINYLPYAAPPGQPCLLSTPDSLEYFQTEEPSSGGRFENRLTLQSLEQMLYFEPTVHVDMISPTPLRLIVAEEDLLAPTDLAIATYAEANEPKSLVLMKGGHFDAYRGKGFELASVPLVTGSSSG